MPCYLSCEKAQFGSLLFMGGSLNQRIACVECFEYLCPDDKIGLEWGYPILDTDKVDPFIHPFFLTYKMDDNWERYPDRYLSIHRGADFFTQADRSVLAVADGSVFRITSSGVYLHHESNGKCYTSYYENVKAHQYLQGIKVEKGKEIGQIKHGHDCVHLEMYKTKLNRAAESSRFFQSGQDWFYGFLRQQDLELIDPLELIGM